MGRLPNWGVDVKHGPGVFYGSGTPTENTRLRIQIASPETERCRYLTLTSSVNVKGMLAFIKVIKGR